jgi:hypothetical protein
MVKINQGAGLGAKRRGELLCDPHRSVPDPMDLGGGAKPRSHGTGEQGVATLLYTAAKGGGKLGVTLPWEWTKTKYRAP